MAKPYELLLYGDIGETWMGDGITEAQVLSGLKELDPQAKQHNIRLNTLGGRVDVGLAIRSLLASHAAQMKVYNPEFKLCTIVDGYAMSVGSIIMLAGDIRRIALGGVVMIHDAWSFAGGNAGDLRKEADSLDKLSENASAIYAKVVNHPDKDAAYFRTLMKEETYFIGEEAVTAGLATEAEQSEAQLCIPCEKIRGQYAKFMATKDRGLVYKRPISAESLLMRKEAEKRLQLLSSSFS